MLIYIKIRVGGIIMSKEKGFFAEFKKFIMRGNVIDLAVDVIIGGAFQAIVKSCRDDRRRFNRLRKVYHGGYQFLHYGACYFCHY